MFLVSAKQRCSPKRGKFTNNAEQMRTFICSVNLLRLMTFLSTTTRRRRNSPLIWRFLSSLLLPTREKLIRSTVTMLSLWKRLGVSSRSCLSRKSTESYPNSMVLSALSMARWTCDSPDCHTWPLVSLDVAENVLIVALDADRGNLPKY